MSVTPPRTCHPQETGEGLDVARRLVWRWRWFWRRAGARLRPIWRRRGMSTIAIDGRLIAADGQRTNGLGIVTARDARKLVVREGRIYAFAGLARLCEPVIAWHMAGADPDRLPRSGRGSGWELVIVDAGGIQSIAGDCPYPLGHVAPAAFGAGAELALGAMLAGADARRAVEIAASCSTHTGGEVMVLDIAEVVSGWGPAW